MEDAQVAPAIPEQALSARCAPADEDVPVLPPIDELNSESDYTVFLKEKVPEALRRAALRKLWTSDPVLANLDGLNDYDEDYNLVDTTIAAVQTAYQAGRGYARGNRGKAGAGRGSARRASEADNRHLKRWRPRGGTRRATPPHGCT